MVLMDIRERIGRIEFEFLVEKKLGTENKENLIMWLMDLFPPESTDPALQQVPEPQALPEEPYVPEHVVRSVEPVHSAQSLPSPPKQAVVVQESIQEVQDFEPPPVSASTTKPDSEALSALVMEELSSFQEPDMSDATPATLGVVEFDLDDKTEERVYPQSEVSPDAQKQPDQLVQLVKNQERFFQNTDSPQNSETSLPNEWTQYTEPVQSMPEIPLGIDTTFSGCIDRGYGHVGDCTMVVIASI